MDPAKATVDPQKIPVDRNMTGLAGELFVAAELLKRGLQTSLTFGNAKQIDLLAHNPVTGQNFSIQVKTLRAKGYFPVREIKKEHIYVFVVLNEPGEAIQYFVIPGQRIIAEPARFDYQDPKFPGLYTRALTEFENAWKFFGS